MLAHSDFVHLHLHTQYSLLDGACKVNDCLELAHSLKMPALAITDHGNMFGAIDFYMNAQRLGIKPIIGCEVYVAPESRHDKILKPGIENAFHLILLAKDETGYRNLVKLVSAGYLEGFYYKPRIDKDILSQHSKGLVGLSACLQGEVASFLKQGRFNDALKSADDYKNILGKDNFYLELQENGILEQKKVNKDLIKLSKEINLSLVATNDVHYLRKEQAHAHEALLCIQTQSNLNDPNHMKFQTDEFYFKTPDEMKKLFKDVPEAIKNTIHIAEQCNLELDFSVLHLPKFDVPEGFDKDSFLKKLCQENLGRVSLESVSKDDLNQRVEHELRIIKDTGFASYFLIVQDFVRFAKDNNIPVGPGRGSAAGSIVSYLLGITDINPLDYGLLFERFLNPDRLSMPDIDIDFCYQRRQEVIDYVTNKYGRENVAQIITFGTMLARAAVRDVGRVMGMSYQDVDRIAKLIPPEPNIQLKTAVSSEPQLKTLYETDPQIKDLIDTATVLEGLSRHASVHAAGVVIADKPLTEYLPLFKTADDSITTGFSMSILEKIGLLKVDFLGLRTLTVIDKSLKIISRTKKEEIDIRKIPKQDEKTFRLLSDADTIGVFQLESTGMRDLLRKLEPHRFEDLIALLALYRPGPIGSGMLDDFIARRHNRVPIIYDHPRLESILKETYGIMVYQEQVMRIASDLAGFSLSQADLLRRAMSKKIPEVMERSRKDFINGCVKNKVAQRIAEKIFDLIEYFSGYGFNKSHSTAYAMISYYTAYLKANYPVEFMCALLSSERDNTDKIVEYVRESENMGIQILPPDVNKSYSEFSVENDKNIRFGLLAVKNVGSTAIESILDSRAKDGEFDSLEELCERVDLRVTNRKVLESLIKCGAFDSFKLHRAHLMSTLDEVLDHASRLNKERQKGQISFFDMVDSSAFNKKPDRSMQVKEWPEPQVLAFEKDLLGFYVSGHPLSKYAKQIKKFRFVNIAQLRSLNDEQRVNLVGLIAKIKYTLTRKNQEKMAILKIEDLDGIIEVLVFPKVYKMVASQLKANNVVLLKGRLMLKEEPPKIIAEDMLPIDKAYNLVSAITIDLTGIKENLFSSLKENLLQHTGQTPVYFHLTAKDRTKKRILASNAYFVTINDEFINSLEEMLGFDKYFLALKDN